MKAVLIAILTISLLVWLGVMICSASDRFERRKGLKRFRKHMLLEPDFSDDWFAAELCEIDEKEVVEMRQMLSDILGIDALKIHPEWRFVEDQNLKNMDLCILVHLPHGLPLIISEITELISFHYKRYRL